MMSLRHRNELARHARATVEPPARRTVLHQGPADLAVTLRAIATMLRTLGVSRAEVVEVQTRPAVLVILAYHPGLDRLPAEWISTGQDAEGRYDWHEITLADVAVRWRKPAAA